MSQSLSRRGFLRSGLAAGAFLGLPATVYRQAFAADTKPSEQIRIGMIGVGRQGKSNMKAVMKHVVAVCDVDQKHLGEAAELVEKAGVKPQTFEDYRKLLEIKDLDAVLISTPDHWHALTTIHACQAGKDVYCEKPLTLTIAEGRAMATAARSNKRIVQTGSQQRSDAKFRQACQIVRNGGLGKITKVLVGLPGPNFSGPAVADSKAPDVLNYNLWLGPAPERPYNEKRVHYLFRFFWDYSGGQQTNFGAHHLDIAQWGLGMDESGPVKIGGKATYNKDGWFETPETATITYKYANGVEMECTLGGKGHRQGTTFIGEKGTIYVTRGKIEGTPMDVLGFKEGDIKLTVSGNHHQNWLECIKTRVLPICDVEIGHRSATVCHLGNIALRIGREITWDPAKEEIVGDKDAAALTSKTYRKPWTLG